MTAANGLHYHSPTAYVTGVSKPALQHLHRPDLALLATPASSVHRHRDRFSWWAADNGCFMENHPRGRPFDAGRWIDWLAACGPRGCKFATLPDVLDWVTIDGTPVPIGNPHATHARSLAHLDAVRDLGLPVAFVMQDGIEREPSMLAEVFELADAVFIGGSDAWKLGPAVRELVAEANTRGVWAHVGRVNSYKRLSYCARIGADSADGTYARFGRENAGRILGWLDALAATEQQGAML